MLPTFTLRETFKRGGGFTWRLKDSEIRFRGSGAYAKLVTQRIPARSGQVANFVSALNLLEVWSWRNDYNPEDIGWMTLDGSAWSFAALIGGSECRCGGANAYPAFGDVSQSSLQQERYALLLAALYDCFDIDAYIRRAKHQRQQEGLDSKSPFGSTD